MRIRNLGFLMAGIAVVGIAILLSKASKPPQQESAPVVVKAVELEGAAAIVHDARMSRVAHSHVKKGSLRRGRDGVKFDVTVSKENQTLVYSVGGRQIEIDYSKRPARVTETVAGGPARMVGVARFGETLEGTEITFADVAEPFWDWPNPQLLEDGEERVSIGIRRDAWVIRMDNPVQGDGPYAVVKGWIDKDLQTLLKLEAYDWNGRKISSWEVAKVSKNRDRGIWVTEKLRIEKIDQVGNTKTSNRIAFEKPVWK